MATIKATIFFEKQFWIGTFERTDKEGFSIARHIFGGEPSDTEIHQFVLDHYQELKFGEPKEITVEIKRVNPKKLQRAMQKFKEASKPSSLAQNYMRAEVEKQKKIKKRMTIVEKSGSKRSSILFKRET